jgi:uncharacterized RDD family membrane protein YckC
VLPYPEPAPLVRRIGARIVDVVLLSWCSAFVVVELGARLFGGDPLGRRAVRVDATSARTILLLAACVLLVEVIPVAISGRTLGKAMVGLRVVDLDGGRPGFAAALIRALLLYGAALALPLAALPVAALLLASVALSVLRRGLHDRLAGTLVVSVVDPRAR